VRGYFRIHGRARVGRDEATIWEYIRNREKEKQKLDLMSLWKRQATVKAGQLNQSRVSDPAQTA
jgi:hypothetical protein